MKSFLSLCLVSALFTFTFPAFAGEPEPEAPGAQSIQGSGVAAEAGVAYPAQVQEVVLPDLPLKDLPSGALSVQFLVEHRTALHEKRVTVKGVILSLLVGEAACPTNGMMRLCAQPRMVLADRSETSRDPHYDLVVLFPQGGGERYHAGETVEISGTVSASPQAVVIRAEE